LRLTLTYTALFVITGTALLGVSYLLVQHREKGAGTAVSVICKRTVDGQTGVQISGTPPAAGPGPGALNPDNCPGAVGLYYKSFGSSSADSGGAVVPAQGGRATVGPTGPEVRQQVGQLATAVRASQAHTLDSFRIGSAIALGLMTILSFLLSWWIAGRALRPVHRITDTALMLSERTLDARINLRGPNDELKQLADTFDAMLGRLERAFHSQRRFVANASHELRTPLATERVLIDEALANRSASPDELRSILTELRANSEDTERLIDALLLLARSERGIEKWSSIDLGATASSVIEQATVEAALAGLTIQSDLEPVEVTGDPGLVERLIGNLVENAMRHNIPGGSIAVRTRLDSDAALLQIMNTGPVIAPDAVAGLVEPFRRAGPDRSSNDGGVGLGLSIVDAIVDAHHGRLNLTAPPEGGLDVRVRLPLTRSAQQGGDPPVPARRDPDRDAQAQLGP
jgi:signal transduction histidine kinase